MGMSMVLNQRKAFRNSTSMLDLAQNQAFSISLRVSTIPIQGQRYQINQASTHQPVAIRRELEKSHWPPWSPPDLGDRSGNLTARGTVTCWSNRSHLCLNNIRRCPTKGDPKIIQDSTIQKFLKLMVTWGSTIKKKKNLENTGSTTVYGRYINL